MHRISLFLLGTILVSGCAADIPQPHRAGMDVVANKLKPIHGVKQETANGKERFVWCGTCPPLTPKTADRPGMAPSAASAEMGEAENRRKPAAIIYFDFNSTVIRPDDEIKLAGLLKGVGRHATVMLRGYTDSTGSRKYNQQLATSRAGAVRRWLSTHIKQQIRYNISAYGKCCYAREPGLSPENRRVEIYIEEEEQ
jgi:outer membrane protein OmpA-like peptidoglycan-associated protein